MTAKNNVIQIGVAEVDITPDYPIRLSGYGSRREESDGIIQPIWAKALAIGDDTEDPVVLVTVENCGLPDELTEEVSRRMKEKTGISRAHFVACFSHTHSAPCLTNAAPFLFSTDMPAHQPKIDRYTHQLTDWMESVALEALANREPSQLTWSIGELGFAKNRRTEGGPGPFVAVYTSQRTDHVGKLRLPLHNTGGNR